MALVRVQAYLQGISNTANDRYINTFYAQGPAVDAASALALCGCVRDFYGSGSTGLSAYLAHKALAELSVHSVTAYNMADTKPRVPLANVMFSLGTDPEDTPLPNEVACCLSFKGAPISGSEPARMRGRVYIGPLNVNTHFAGGQTASRPLSVFRGAIITAALAMSGAMNTQGFQWVVHSPTEGDLAWTRVRDTWVDDSFDTVRSRGLKPSTRDVGTAIVVTGTAAASGAQGTG